MGICEAGGSPCADGSSRSARWYRSSAWRLGVLGLGAAALLTGCPNPQTYGTPRTTPKGKVTHTVAPEGMMVRGKTPVYTVDELSGEEQVEEVDFSVGFPLPPSYHLRVGVADRVDIGFRVPNMSSLGADVKVNPVRGDFDFAVDPGLQWYSYSVGPESVNLVYLHLPLMIGINLSPDVSLVLTPGAVYAYAVSTWDDEFDTDWGGVFTSSGLMGRLGVGFDFRINSDFGLHPEITAMRGVTDDLAELDGTMVLFGLGFNIANLPDFSDVGDGGAR